MTYSSIPVSQSTLILSIHPPNDTTQTPTQPRKDITERRRSRTNLRIPTTALPPHSTMPLNDHRLPAFPLRQPPRNRKSNYTASDNLLPISTHHIYKLSTQKREDKTISQPTHRVREIPPTHPSHR